MKNSEWQWVVGIGVVIGLLVLLNRNNEADVDLPDPIPDALPVIEPTLEGRTAQQWREFAATANDPDRCKAVQCMAKLHEQSTKALPAILATMAEEQVPWVAIDMIHTLQWISPADERMADAVGAV